MKRYPLWSASRRDFLKASAALATAGLSSGAVSVRAGSRRPESIMRFGIATDLHYADTEPKGTRFYRESLPKMAECVELMNSRDVDFLVELGDFKDQGAPVSEAGTLRYLSDIESTFRKFNGPRYHVLGNHDADSISKEQFSAVIANTGIPESATYYSFDMKGLHFVVLDANFNVDGSPYDNGNFDWTDANIAGKEIDWLKADLASTSLPVIVFVHQLLDGEGEHYINNAAETRLVLEQHRNVLAVFQGHQHMGDYNTIENIHYYTLRAMVEGSGAENNSYAIVEVMKDNSIVVTGWHRALSMELS